MEIATYGVGLFTPVILEQLKSPELQAVWLRATLP